MARVIIEAGGIEHNFWCPDSGGYAYRESPGYPGTSGIQLCSGGSHIGETISATPATLETVARKWLKDKGVL